MAALSETDIANRALSKLGEVRITDLNSDTTKGGRAMLHRFAHCRDSLLQSYPWRFALKRDSLAALTAAPAWGYSVAYQMPSDCLRFVTIGEYAVNAETVGLTVAVSSDWGAFDAPCEIVGDQIHTDLTAPLNVEYVRQVTDTGLFPDLFSEALACRLAYDACEEITQSDTKKQAAAADAEEAWKMAARVDALQRPPGKRTPGLWMTARVSGG